LQNEQQRNEIAPSNPTVDDGVDGRSIARGIETPDEPGRMRAHRRQQRLDRVQDARDAAKGERRSTEPDDLAILGRGVAPDEVNRIGRRVDVIECPVKILEARDELRLGPLTSGTA